MKSSLTVLLDEPLEQLVSRHPLLAGYFVNHSKGNPDLSRTVQQHLQNRGIDRAQLEGELQEHLRSAVRPDPEDCETLSCRPLPFCPEAVFEIPSREVLSWLLRFVKNPVDWFRRTIRFLVRFVGKQSRTLRTNFS